MWDVLLFSVLLRKEKQNQCLNVTKVPLGKAAADFRDVENLRVEMDKIY